MNHYVICNHIFLQEPAYNPQVEAISPTLPGEDTRAELSSVKSSKNEVLGQITKVDHEIGIAEGQISKLRKKMVCLAIYNTKHLYT